MPNVAKPGLPSIAGQGIPDVRTTYDVRGTSLVGGLGNALESTILPEARKAQAKAKKDADDTWIREQKANILKWTQRNIYATPDQNPEAAINQTGTKAANLTPRFMEEYDRFVSEIKGNNAEQSAEIEDFKLGQGNKLYNELNDHERRQYDAMAKASYQTVQEEYDRDAVAHAHDDAAIELIAEEKTKEAKREAERTGTTKFLEDQLSFEISKMWLGVLQVRRDISATDTIKKYDELVAAKKLDPTIPAVMQFHKTLQPVADGEAGVREAQRRLGEIVSDPLDQSKSVVISAATALAKLAKEQTNPKTAMKPAVFEAAFNYMNSVTKAVDAAKDEESQELYKSALDRMVNGTQPGWTPQTDPNWNRLADTGYQYALVNAWDARNKARSDNAKDRREQERLDRLALERYTILLNKNNPEAVVEGNLKNPKFWEDTLGIPYGSVTDLGIAKMGKKWSEIFAADRKADQTGRAEFRARVLTRINAMPLWTKKLGKTQTDQVVSALMEMYEQTVVENNGKRPSAEAVDKLLDEKLTRGVVQTPGSFWGSWSDEEMLRVQYEAGASTVFKGKTWTTRPARGLPPTFLNPNRSSYTPLRSTEDSVLVYDEKGDIRVIPRADWEEAKKNNHPSVQGLKELEE